jgi:hypothetical protein
MSNCTGHPSRFSEPTDDKFSGTLMSNLCTTTYIFDNLIFHHPAALINGLVYVDITVKQLRNLPDDDYLRSKHVVEASFKSDKVARQQCLSTRRSCTFETAHVNKNRNIFDS